MTIDKKYIDQFINVTSKAALASSFLVGKKDKIAADGAAVDAMRKQLNDIDMNGKIVIGEGELDEAPMLFIGENLGTNWKARVRATLEENSSDVDGWLGKYDLFHNKDKGEGNWILRELDESSHEGRLNLWKKIKKSIAS